MDGRMNFVLYHFGRDGSITIFHSLILLHFLTRGCYHIKNSNPNNNKLETVNIRTEDYQQSILSNCEQ